MLSLPQIYRASIYLTLKKIRSASRYRLATHSTTVLLLPAIGGLWGLLSCGLPMRVAPSTNPNHAEDAYLVEKGLYNDDGPYGGKISRGHRVDTGYAKVTADLLSLWIGSLVMAVCYLHLGVEPCSWIFKSIQSLRLDLPFHVDLWAFVLGVAAYIFILSRLYRTWYKVSFAPPALLTGIMFFSALGIVSGATVNEMMLVFAPTGLNICLTILRLTQKPLEIYATY